MVRGHTHTQSTTCISVFVLLLSHALSSCWCSLGCHLQIQATDIWFRSRVRPGIEYCCLVGVSPLLLEDLSLLDRMQEVLHHLASSLVCFCEVHISDNLSDVLPRYGPLSSFLENFVTFSSPFINYKNPGALGCKETRISSVKHKFLVIVITFYIGY